MASGRCHAAQHGKENAGWLTSCRLPVRARSSWSMMSRGTANWSLQVGPPDTPQKDVAGRGGNGILMRIGPGQRSKSEGRNPKAERGVGGLARSFTKAAGAEWANAGLSAHPLRKPRNRSALRDAQGSGSGAIPKHRQSNTGAVPSGNAGGMRSTECGVRKAEWCFGRRLPKEAPT